MASTPRHSLANGMVSVVMMVPMVMMSDKHGQQQQE
jgi:hypothetical protein